MAPLWATCKKSGNKRWIKVVADDPQDLENIARLNGTEVKPGTPVMPPHCDLPPRLIQFSGRNSEKGD